MPLDSLKTTRDWQAHTGTVCILPIGSCEQHGPHLPLNTDAVIAEELTRRMIARWGDVIRRAKIEPQ